MGLECDFILVSLQILSVTRVIANTNVKLLNSFTTWWCSENGPLVAKVKSCKVILAILNFLSRTHPYNSNFINGLIIPHLNPNRLQARMLFTVLFFLNCWTLRLNLLDVSVSLERESQLWGLALTTYALSSSPPTLSWLSPCWVSSPFHACD